MNIAIAAYTKAGAALAETLCAALNAAGENARFYVSQKNAAEGQAAFTRSGAWAAEHFSAEDALVFVGAAGIAVRAVAPLLQSKLTDPAVLSLDEKGEYVLALLSGHVGGANRLARRLAHLTGGHAVVSTATDVNGRFAVDEWAARGGMTLEDPHAVRAFAGALLDGQSVGFHSRARVLGALPDGVVPGVHGEIGLYVGDRKDRPFRETVTVVPRCLTLGLGCRRGTPQSAIAAAVRDVFEENGLYESAIRDAASIDLKADEKGLTGFCATRGLPIRFYAADALREVPEPIGGFTRSGFVASVTGVDNVCERAALAQGGDLIVRKTARNGVTVAVARHEVCLNFQQEELS